MSPRAPFVVLVLALAACASQDPGCPASPCSISIAGYVPVRDDVIYLGSSAGLGVAAVTRYTAGGDAQRMILPLVDAEGSSLQRSPGMNLRFAIPGDGVNVTVSWIEHAHPSGFAGSLAPLELGGHELTIQGTPGPDRLAVATDGPIVLDSGDGNDVLVVGGERVTVTAGNGNDAVTILDRGGGHVVDGGPGRDRLIVGGARATILGGDGDDCLLPLAPSGWSLVDGGPGLDRSPRELGAAVERGSLDRSLEGFTWCGPAAALSVEDDAASWPDAEARAIEAALTDAILARRAASPTCGLAAWHPAAVRFLGPSARRLQGVARAHAASVDGYPGPQSDAWADGAFVPSHLVTDGAAAHQDRDGEWYDQRVLRAGDPVTLAEGGVREAVSRCVASETACAGGPARVASRFLESFIVSQGHCDLLMGRDDPATGVVIAVGVHRQDRGVSGALLDPPGWFADVLVEDDVGDAR